MKRTLLIARREYAAYAMTVGFWLSLLAFPLFAVLGGALPVLMRTSEPVRAVAIVEDGPAAQGLASAIRESLQRDADRQAERARETAEKAQKAGAPPQAGVGDGALAALSRPRLRLVPTPAEITSTTGEAQVQAVRAALSEDKPKGERLDAVVFLTRVDGRPGARVWTARATDDTVEDFVRDSMKSANRQTVFGAAGIDATVVEQTERFRPQVTAYSPKAAEGGQVSLRDRLPVFIGLGGGFLLWSLIITGASILLNSVMEEKSNKILEVLLSSASATEILAGKVLGVALLTLTVLLAWGGIGAVGLLSTVPDVAYEIGQVLLHGGLIGWFVAFMVGGYLMYAVLFAAIGSFCETPRDAQTLMGPIMMILVIPMITMQMAIRTPDAPLVTILSLVPFFTPFLMMARLPSDPPMIELVGAMAGMVAFALLMIWVSGRAFRAGALSDVKLSWKSFVGAIRGGGR